MLNENIISRWRHEIETYSAVLVGGEFTGHRWMHLTKASNAGLFFDLRLNKRLSKPSIRRWFQTPPRSLWRHPNVNLYVIQQFVHVSYGTEALRHSYGRIVRHNDQHDQMIASSNLYGEIFRTLHWISHEFHQPRLVIRTFHHQGRCSRGGHLCNEHSEEKYSCYK